MDYVFEKIIPINTAKSAALSEELFLPAGTIKHGAILFPAGCAGLAHVVVYHDEHQVWPSTPDATYHGEDGTIEFPADYRLPSGSNRFTVFFWNEDTVHTHTVTVILTVLEDREGPGSLAERYPRLGQFLDALRGQ